MKKTVVLLVGLAWCVSGCNCGGDKPEVDAGGVDSGVPDAGTPDAGKPDAGAPDAGTPDAGTPDAGTPDAGVPDAGWVDITNVSDQTAAVGSTFTLQLVAAANDPITFSVQSGALPGGLSLDPDSGVITGTLLPASLVTGSPAGDHRLVIRASTPRATDDTAPFTIAVTGVALPKPLVYWSFDTASLTDGGLVMQDGTANDHDGVLSGGVTANGTSSIGQSFSYDGVNDLVQGANIPAPAGDYTLVIAAKPVIDGQPRIPMAYGMSAPTPYFRGTWLQVQGNGTVTGVFEDGSDVLANGATVLDAGTWAPLGITWQAATRQGRLYVNGRFDAMATAAGPQLFATTTLECGRHSQFMTRFWKGELDEAAMFHVRLDDEQMATVAWHFLRGRDLATVTNLP